MKSRRGVRTKEGPEGGSWGVVIAGTRLPDHSLSKVQERPKGTFVSRGLQRKITALKCGPCLPRQT